MFIKALRVARNKISSSLGEKKGRTRLETLSRPARHTLSEHKELSALHEQHRPGRPRTGNEDERQCRGSTAATRFLSSQPTSGNDTSKTTNSRKKEGTTASSPHCWERHHASSLRNPITCCPTNKRRRLISGKRRPARKSAESLIILQTQVFAQTPQRRRVGFPPYVRNKSPTHNLSKSVYQSGGVLSGGRACPGKCSH